jgi:hypothetical protein
MYGKAAALVGNMTVHAFLLSKKIMTAIYLAKWQGKVRFNRLLHIKGEQNGLTFINIGLEPDSRENREVFDGILKELKDHHILYAVMPDLCAGDGATQIAISNIDVSKFNSFAIDHKMGKYGHIQVAEISEYDYTLTGTKADGSLTFEAESLVNQAKKKIEQEVRKARTYIQRVLRQIWHKIRQILHLENPFEAPVFYRYEASLSPLRRKTGKPLLCWKPLLLAAKVHDMSTLLGIDGYMWIRKPAIVTDTINNELYHLVPMENGTEAVIVSDLYYKAPVLPEDFEDLSIPCGFLISKGQTYLVVNLETNEVKEETGASIMEREKTAKAPDVSETTELVSQNRKNDKISRGQKYEPRNASKKANDQDSIRNKVQEDMKTRQQEGWEAQKNREKKGTKR